MGQHPAEKKSQRSDLLQPLSLPRPQPGREVLQQDQTMSSRRATTGLPPTTLPSFNSRQLGYGCGLMSPRPNEPLLFYRVPLKYPFQFIDLVLVLLFGYRGALEINEILKG